MGTMKDTPEGSKLRQRAEKELEIAAGSTEAQSEMSPEEMARLIHELQVHQIELKMQNDELRRIQDDLEKTRDKYSNLYDFAPIGYFTVNQKGFIDEANLTIASMLGVERSALIGQLFARFVLRDDQDSFYMHRQRLLETETSQSCELRLVKKDGGAFYARLDCTVITKKGDDGKQIRAAVGDVTEHKRAEEMLQESEKKYRALFSNAQVALFRTRLFDGKLLEINERYANMAGFSNIEDCIAEFNAADAWVDLNSRNHMLRLVKENGFVNDYDTEIIRNDGTRIWISFSATIFPEQGFLEGSIIDITDRKRMEEALRESEERFRVAFLANPSSVAIGRQEDGVWIDVNQAALDIFGYTREEVIGKSALDANLWVDPKDRQRIVLALGRSGVENQEVQLRRKDGSVIIASVSAQALTLKGVKHFLFITEDITARKQAEEATRYAMKVSQAVNRINALVHRTLVYDAIMQNILSEGIATLGCGSAVTSLRQESGWTITHVCGMPDDYIGAQMTDDQERHALLALQSRKPVLVDDAFHDHRFNREHFRRHNIRAVLIVPLVVHDVPLGAIFFNYHTGTHKFMEAEVQFVRQLSAMASVALQNARLFAENSQTNQALQKARDELELRVRERTVELEKANAKLVKYNSQLGELNKELQDFAFIASHDLQEPLRKVQTFGDMLAAEYAARLGEPFTDYLDRMQNATARMKDLLDSLLAYSRVVTQAKPLKETDLRRSAEDALSNLQIMIEEKNARVEVRDLPTIRTDPVQMIQLFQNLITNALKFHQPDKSPNVKIYGRMKDENGAHEICVEDNGIGFQDKYLDRIFMPFQRLHGRTSSYRGTGMGLAICKKIVERHGGEITAKSELDKGSTFIVSFPAKKNQI